MCLLFVWYNLMHRNLTKIYTKKNFKNREEQLEYENMKLRIENERLKI